MTKHSKDQVEHAEQTLRRLCPEGTKVLGIVRHVAPSGMSRDIEFFVADDGEVLDITYYIAVVLDRNRNDRGIRVSGCGMDMVFATIYDLGHRLYGNGYALKQTRG